MNCPATVLFDLDGTLTDSKPGILGCLRKALQQLDIPYNGPLEQFIGPPVEQWAVEILPNAGESARQTLASTYRALYDREGWAINSVYPGIPEMLATLNERQVRLYVCTSKHEPFAERIVTKFGIREFFAGVYGDRPGDDHSKSALVARLLKGENLSPACTSMVGDRSYDVVAARANSLRALGAGWGYGSVEELNAAGAEILCPTPNDVVESILAVQQV